MGREKLAELSEQDAARTAAREAREAREKAPAEAALHRARHYVDKGVNAGYTNQNHELMAGLLAVAEQLAGINTSLRVLALGAVKEYGV